MGDTPDRPSTGTRWPVAIHWFLPTGGDSREVVPPDPSASRAPDHGYLAQVATACDHLGFDAVLTPCGTGCEDAWVATATLIPLTRQLRFLVAFRPGFLNPTQAAQMAATYQAMSGGRLMINIVIGAEPAELARFGDHLSKDERYRRSAEFLTVLRGALGSTSFDFDGDFYRVEAATTRHSPVESPPIFFGGASDAAEAVAATHVDTYLLWGEPPEAAGGRLERMRERAATATRANGADLEFGIRFHVITRDTADEAWAEAARLLRGMDPAAVPRRGPTSPPPPRSANGAWPTCTPRSTACPRTPATWRSHPTSGPGSAWSAVGPEPFSSAATPRSRTGSRSTTGWGSGSSSCRATRTWRRRGASATDSCPSCVAAG